MRNTSGLSNSAALDRTADASVDLLRALLLAIPALWALGYLFPPLNHDVGALLQFSQRMLAGERLYVDLIDINPPMIFLLNLVPALFGRVTGISAPTSLALSILAASAVSIFMARPLMERLAGADRPLLRLLLPLFALFALFVLPAHSFGQRGHLLFVFALPYLAYSALRLRGETLPARQAAAVGAFAALGILLKPHYATLPVLVELTVLCAVGLRSSLREAGPWAIFAAGVIYVAGVLLWLPDYLDVIVPMVSDHYAGFEAGALTGILLGDQVPAVALPLVLFAALAWYRRDPAGQVLAAAVLGALVFGVAQGKGWDYHFLPARQLLLLLATTAIAGEIERMLPQRAVTGTRRLAPAGYGIALALLGAVFFLSGALSPPFKGQQRFADTVSARLLPIVKAQAEGQPVMWLSTSIYPQFPVLNYANSPIASHFMSLWLLPAIYKHAHPTPDGRVIYTPPERMSDAERLVFETTASDLVKFRPPLVIVERASTEGGFRGLPFDYLDYFRRNPAFAVEWANYRPLATVGTLTLYRRR